MHSDDIRDTIIVSDLHLSVGANPRTGGTGHPDDFFCDAAFMRFLDDLRDRAAEDGHGLRLVILGDLFDFLQLEIRSLSHAKPSLDTCAEASRANLDCLVDAHAGLFSALARCVAAGWLLDIVPGNHDIELIHPSVQNRFKELMVRFGGRAEAASNIRFHPWIYYIPRVLYAEHGHQYHDINWFATLLQPYRPQDPAQIELPPASYFDGHWGRGPLLEAIQQPTDCTAPPHPRFPYLSLALRTRPLSSLAALDQYVHMMRVILRHAAQRANGALSVRRLAYQEEVLRPYAMEVGLSDDTLIAIDNMAAEMAMTMKQRLLRQVVHVQPPGRSSAYLRRVVPAIHDILRAAQQDVPYYVFGHTHIAERLPLCSTAVTPCYLNSGTWTPIAPTAAGNRQRFTCVHISHAPGVTPVAHLLLWDDSTGRRESLA
jgi:UDP-2,3-diacylglucosamine pyrophosphatase LpxH